MHKFKNDLLLEALRGNSLSRPPVWIMRQAGRYLPGYRSLREKYSFFERCENPELSTEITLQPVEKIGVDAAIIFSDILVVPRAMGMEVQLVPQRGPVIPNPIRTENDLKMLSVPDVKDRLHFVFEAMRLTKETLNGKVPLIGFAGAPWTLFCYMVQGEGSKTFEVARSFLYQYPQLAHKVLEMIARTTITYLREQIKAGADCIQLFDSWSSVLSPDMFEQVSLYYNQRIIEALSEDCPVILFAKGAWFGLEKMRDTGAVALGLDWNIRPETAREMTGNKMTLQGNMDPAKLLTPIPEIKREVTKMIEAFGAKNYIVNLGHGILSNTPVDHARAFVDAVKAYHS